MSAYRTSLAAETELLARHKQQQSFEFAVKHFFFLMQVFWDEVQEVQSLEMRYMMFRFFSLHFILKRGSA